MIPISQTSQLWTATHRSEGDRRRAEERLGRLAARWARRRRQPEQPERDDRLHHQHERLRQG
jgi:hypothetical protein